MARARSPGLRYARLTGQIVDQAKAAPQKPCYPVVLQSKTEPMAAATTNATGELQLDFDAHAQMKLEIGVRERQWISLELPDFSSSTQGTQD